MTADLDPARSTPHEALAVEMRRMDLATARAFGQMLDELLAGLPDGSTHEVWVVAVLRAAGEAERSGSTLAPALRVLAHTAVDDVTLALMEADL